MKRTPIYLYLFLITFYACSDEINSDQIAGNYSFGTLLCHEFQTEDEFENVQINHFPDGSIEIDLGLPTGILQGEISDDSEIRMLAYQGNTSSGIELDLPSGTGDFILSERSNGQSKTVHIRFHTLVDTSNVCSLILNEF